MSDFTVYVDVTVIGVSVFLLLAVFQKIVPHRPKWIDYFSYLIAGVVAATILKIMGASL
jgi:hypothetical protein